MIYKSYAKINLGLEVLYKRPDGYHEINTIFHQICLADEIEIKPHNSIKINCIPDLGIQQEQNLAFKACKLLQNNYDCKLKGAEITIFKKIPAGGGLGGGSSNAATVLKALNKLWDLNLSELTLMKLGLQLGSDVPFFIKGGTAIGKGRGEVLQFIEFKLPYYIFLLFPKTHISTVQAYSDLRRTENATSGTDYISLIGDIGNTNKINNILRNDFEEPIYTKYPILKYYKEQILNSGAVYAQMSGSGSTIFGLFNNMLDLELVKQKHKHRKTHICIESTI